MTTIIDHPITAPSDGHSLWQGGPNLLEDLHRIERFAQRGHEGVPERVMHARRSGAHGLFEVSEDVTAWTKASFLKVGKQTPVFVRFATVVGELGGTDTVRDPRGFAVRFSTDEGPYDLVGSNTPIASVRHPRKLGDFVRSQRCHPVTGMRDHNRQWDFWSRSPESIHQVMFLFGDRGTPRTYRHMNGYSSHATTWVNADGATSFVRCHWKTAQGIESFTDAEAADIVREDPDFHRRDLFDAVDRGNAPEWRLEVQIMSVAEAESYRFDPFDPTKVWPHGDFPPITVGRMVLDRNPENYFAEVEQAASAPVCFVPGVEASPAPSRLHAGDDDYGQPGTLWRRVLSDTDKDHLVANLATHMRQGVDRSVITRQVGQFRRVAPELGARVAEALGTGA